MSEQILVAIIATVGVIGAAGFGFLGVVITNLKAAIGEPNGKGNVVQMMEALLSGQAGQDKRLASLEGRVSQIEVTVRDWEQEAS